MHYINEDDEEHSTHWCSKFFIPLLTVSVATAVLAFCYTVSVQNYYDKSVTAERCNAQLESTMHQLEVVMDYKYRTDLMLADIQKHHKIDKDRFKDMMETCFAITQQSLGCQNQFDALQMKCQKNREDCEKMVKELRVIKSLENTTFMT